jgi:thiamine-phosphate pyrophosphorylase
MDYSLYLVTDENITDLDKFLAIIKLAAEGGVTMVQLREKKLNTRQFAEKAIQLKKILKPYGIPLIINDRVDVAMAVKADGVHIGQTDMPAEMIKRIIPAEMITGLSVETFEQAEEAEKYDIDYIGISPVFSTPTKTNFNEKPWGLEGLKKLKRFSKHKLVAIGGINRENASEVIRAGADGLAVVSAICSSADPKTAAQELLSIIRKSKIE